MLIEEYLQELEGAVAQAHFAVDVQLVFDKRSLYIAFIEGILAFLDGSTLHFMEFVNVKEKINKYKYSYHYQLNDSLIFRYDMAPHHQEVDTFPHHKHTADGQVVNAAAPSLLDILEEIESMVM